MMPILYEPTETAFTSNGIGVLSDCISCLVTEERNGPYELEIEYPANGLWADDIDTGCIIKAKANDTDAPQLFIIYDVIRTLTGAYTVKAEHISYRLCGVPVKPFTAAGAAAALEQLVAKAVIPPGFTFDTDNTSTTEYKIKTPRSARAVLGGEEGSLLDVYGGEYHFDNFKVHFLKARGADNGVTIRYGKNLTELEQEVNGSVYNGIFPFWYNETDGVVYPTSAEAAPGTFPVPFYETKDLTEEFSKKPTKAQLTARAQSLVNGMGHPVETINISFITLHQLKEYATIAALEHVSLCDTVRVIYDTIGVNAKMKVVKTVFNTLTDMYDSIEVGESQTSLADIISGMSDRKAVIPIGEYVDVTGTVSLTSGTSDTVCTTGELTPGLYLMTAEANWDTNATGRRTVSLAAQSGNEWVTDPLATSAVNAVSGVRTRGHIAFVVALTTETTYGLRAFQNSGSALSCSGTIRVLKLSA